MTHNSLPGYDAWKLATPPYADITEEEERELEEKREIAEQDLRDAIARALTDYRDGIYLATVREIVIEELNKLPRLPEEPEWQTKTPVPIPAMG